MSHEETTLLQELLGQLKELNATLGGEHPRQKHRSAAIIGHPAAQLSQRETAVMRLVADGLTNSQIAAALRISPHTVKNVVYHIFDKLGISNRVELAIYATSERGDCHVKAVDPIPRSKPAAGGQLLSAQS